MYRRALLAIIVYVAFNLVTLHAFSDPILEQKAAELQKCVNDLATPDGKDKICYNITDLETQKQAIKDYISKTHGNKTVNENAEYAEIIKNALSDKRFTNVTKNQECINTTALKNCKTKQYIAPEETPLIKKYLSKNYKISLKRSACNNAKKIYACILSDAFDNCDNSIAVFYKEMMDKMLKECLVIMKDSDIESPSGAARYLQTTLRSVSMAFFAFILL